MMSIPVPLTGTQLAATGIVICERPPKYRKPVALGPGWPKGWLLYYPPLHSTSMASYAVCKRKFFLQERLGLKRIGKWASALELGAAYHEMGALLLCGSSPAEAFRDLSSRMQERVVELGTHRNSAGILPSGELFSEVEATAKEGFGKAMAMAILYFQKYPANNDRFEVLGIETSITARVNRGPLITSTLDVIVSERSTGHLWIVDHKTTGRDTRSGVLSLPFDTQPHLYRIPLTARYPDAPIVGAIHNIVQTPGIKYCPRTLDKAGFWESYIPRLEAWYAKQEAPFVCSEVRFTGRWLPRDILQNIGDMTRPLRCKPDLRMFPRVSQRHVCCGTFGPCEFLPFCTEQHCRPATWGAIAQGRFVQDHRDFPAKAPEKTGD